MTTSKPRPIGCRAHCARCNRHFSGVAAFDEHLIREYRDDPVRGTACNGPDDTNDLVVASHDGSCAHMPGGTVAPVTIFTVEHPPDD